MCGLVNRFLDNVVLQFTSDNNDRDIHKDRTKRKKTDKQIIIGMCNQAAEAAVVMLKRINRSIQIHRKEAKNPPHKIQSNLNLTTK